MSEGSERGSERERERIRSWEASSLRAMSCALINRGSKPRLMEANDIRAHRADLEKRNQKQSRRESEEIMSFEKLVRARMTFRPTDS